MDPKLVLRHTILVINSPILIINRINFGLYMASLYRSHIDSYKTYIPYMPQLTPTSPILVIYKPHYGP